MSRAPGPRIALIHAVALAIPPVAAAFEQLWPEAERINLLDDALSVDRARTNELTPAMADRITRLGAYAKDVGAAGILYTCSAFGAAIEAVARTSKVPVLKPNEAMFEAALAQGCRIGMVATFEASVASMEEEFRALARTTRPEATISSVCVPAALAAARAGDAAEHDRLVAEAAIALKDCDAILLAQFSVAGAADAVAAATGRPVLTSPASAVAKLRQKLLGA